MIFLKKKLIRITTAHCDSPNKQQQIIVLCNYHSCLDIFIFAYIGKIFILVETLLIPTAYMDDVCVYLQQRVNKDTK